MASPDGVSGTDGGRPGRSSPRRVYCVVVFAVGFVTLLVELLLTKMLAFVFWNHIVYLIISIALLGYGASSTFILVLERAIKRVSPAAFLAVNLALAFLSILGAIALIASLDVSVRVDELSNSLQPLPLTYFALVAPFFFSGNVLVYVFFRHPEASHRLYFWDLLGAAAGCAVFPWVISRLGSVVGTAVAAGLLGVPLVLLTVEWARGAGGRAAAFGLSAAVGAAAFAGVYFARFVDPRPDSTKSLGFALNEQINPHVRREYSKWDAVTRLDIVSSGNGAPIDMGWAKFDPNAKLVTFDGDAISVIRHRAPDFPSASEVAEFRASSPEMPFLENAVGGEHLIIGLGGGLDIEDSLELGARSITGVDVNAAIIKAMKGPYASFSGRIFLRPNVKVVHSEGRAYLRGINEKFDLIRMRGVDTFAALSTGAYVLAENYLYTVEALREYFRHLNGHGVLCIQRWFYDKKPRETLRLFALALEALRQEGVAHPEEHIAVLRPSAYGVTFIRASPFSPDESARIAAALRERGNPLVVYLPFVAEEAHPAAAIFHGYVRAFREGTAEAFAGAYPYDITPVSDDSPFFFNYYRLASMFSDQSEGPIQGYWAYFVFLVIGLWAVIGVAIFILFPLLVFRRTGIATRGAGLASLFFASIGLGFIMIEIVLMQKFALVLGHPMLSISTVLAGMLLFAGVGSWVSDRWARAGARSLQRAAIGVAVLCLFFASPASHPLFDGLVGRSLPVRVLGTIGLIMPLAFAMGTFFPTGMAIVAKRASEFVAWGWGINGGFTVIGSVLAIVLAMAFGFSRVLVVAAIVYVGAALAMRRYEAVGDASGEEPSS